LTYLQRASQGSMPEFLVDAVTTLGTITTNLPGVVVAHPIVVGMEPRALLALKSTIGAIELQVWALAAPQSNGVSGGQYALG
jgi:hypothetical protein